MNSFSLALRKRASEIISPERPNDNRSRWFDYGLISLIILNVISVVVGSIDEVYQQYEAELYCFEVFSVIVFTIEYVARFWSCVDASTNGSASPRKARLRYMFSPIALVDLISILPFYLAYFTAIDLRILRIVRLLRVFKLARYSGALHTMLAVLAKEAGALGAAFLVMFLIMLLAASGMYAIEHRVQPENFSSIPEAMWWAVATLTTVGYGDVVPVTPLGKLFSGVIIFLGVAMVALPTGIIVSGFADTFRRRRVHYESLMGAAMEDGALTHQEKQELLEIRDQLDISAEDAELIYRMTLGRFKRENASCCPHCGKSGASQD
ncbi:MAG: ion transporter [Porticoccus sp.]